MKKHLFLALVLAMAVTLTACGGGSNPSEPVDAPPADTQSQAPATCDPEKKAILVVSFGTSYNESRELTIEAIEADITAAYPDWEVRRAFTAQTIIDILADRDGLEVDNVTQAMEKLIADGYGTVVVQPTHVMNGFEYDDMVAEVSVFTDRFASVRLGAPLLSSNEDYGEVVDALFAQIPETGAADAAIVFMGHGTEHFANAAYSQLELTMHSAGYENAFVGTVEGFPTLDDVLAKVTAMGADKVVLYPFMIVAGDHAHNDMAGDEEDSWKTAFEHAGFQVECRLVGLGQNAGVRALILEHLAEAVN